ncbi:LacI family DNA-binding transcriptional regulator [Actinotalea sp.]|uniref:LacI family DNA-binding transcriptional regulator n=1 Tax=Actinotalea sp. TaxID=1872145 RepID=UPI002BEA117B|nr:LacI family DNA-binding transcriptional regulator [Actinotalea sp.]HQY33674.1 LacI family DNA-binding transcriptional regulator [Actinotalea sp.]HRA50700.1 LacI family DNA-binding transcriptional regulator [Actinotalea sp.]
MATMVDVARLAHVSLSTVSYALSGARPVSAATKERIEAAMAELDFRPNAMARSLASRRSRTLALIYPVMEATMGGTVAEFVTSAASAARQAGYHLVLWPFGAHQAEEIRDLVQQGMADGVLLMEVCLADARVDVLHAAGVPFTMIGRTARPEGLACVDVDFALTTEEAVAHLAGLGHTRIGFLNHSAASFEDGYGATVRAREGFRRAMLDRGLVPHDVLCDESPAAGRAAMARLLEAEPGLTAVVTMNEVATFGATVELQDRGLRIPQDVSVLSIVTSPGVGAMSNPPLTTMHAPGAELGRLGVQALLGLIEGAAPVADPVLVSCRLEAGESTARVRSGPGPSTLPPASLPAPPT